MRKHGENSTIIDTEKAFYESFSFIEEAVKPFIPNFSPARGKLLAQFRILTALCRRHAKMLDMGCGHGFLAMIMSSIDWDVHAVDNQQDYPVNYKGPDLESCLAVDRQLWEHFGVAYVARNLYDGLPYDDETFDVIVLSDVLEHFHDSPKPILESAVKKLKKKGFLLIHTPNSVNVKKRIKVLFGRSNYPPLDDWFFNGSPWVGHVREPTLHELEKIIEYCGMRLHKSGGHNFITRKQLPRCIQLPASLMAKLLPSSAANIYAIGQKP